MISASATDARRYSIHPPMVYCFLRMMSQPALSIVRTLTVNLTAYPIMYMLINVSPSISYGIRFYSQSSGSTVPLWAESDALSHRGGPGQAENIQVNMFQDRKSTRLNSSH